MGFIGSTCTASPGVGGGDADDGQAAQPLRRLLLAQDEGGIYAAHLRHHQCHQHQVVRRGLHPGPGAYTRPISAQCKRFLWDRKCI